MATTPARRIEVVAAVISDGGRYLACRRRPDKSAGGKWEFPGGKVEVGEVPSDALAREISEELGIGIILLERLQTDVTTVGADQIELTCYSAALGATRPTSSVDHDELRWVQASDLLELDWAAPDLPVVGRLVAEGELARSRPILGGDN